MEIFSKIAEIVGTSEEPVIIELGIFNFVKTNNTF